MAETFFNILNDARNGIGSDSLFPLDLSGSSAEVLEGISATNTAWKKMLNHSTDLQFASGRKDITLLNGSNLPVLPDDIAVDTIKYIKILNANGTALDDLFFIEDERAEELEGIDPEEGRPRFYYTYQNQLKIIPYADQNYTLKIGYQKQYDRIDETNIQDEVPFDRKWDLVLLEGILAQLKIKARHSDAPEAEARFLKSLKDTARHLNKWNKKRAGHSRVTYRNRTRRTIL
jgi:hypothetical protein